MRIVAISLAAGLISTSALAQPSDWSQPQRVEVTLSSFDFTPNRIHLHAHQPVLLHLVNTAGGGHNFSAPQFFAAAQVRPADQGLVHKGTVEVAGHAERDIMLVPAAGHFRLKCTHTMHTLFGMSGTIDVD